MIRAWAVAASLAAAGVAGWTVATWRAGSTIASLKSEHATAVARAARAAEATANEYRAREQQMAAKAAEVADNAQAVLAHLDTAHVRADAIGRSLRDAYRAYRPAACQTTSGPAPTATSQATPETTDLRADVFGRLDEAAGELARFADLASAAGQACQRIYEAVR